MRYEMFYNERGQRLWLPILAGAAIISAPFWLNGRPCCGNNQGYYPQAGNPQYQYNYTYPQSTAPQYQYNYTYPPVYPTPVYNYPNPFIR